MRKQLFSQFRLVLVLQVPAGERLIVAEGERTTNLTVPVRSGGRPYLPGSSLKGVLRSRAEFIAGIIRQHSAAELDPEQRLGTCHLFDRIPHKNQEKLPARLSCGDRFALRSEPVHLAPEIYYRQACPACRLFGHTYFAGRLKVTDFNLLSEAELQEIHQTHVAIDRITGGAGEKKLYEMQYLTRASFGGEIVLENFSLWELGWLGLLLRDLEQGRLRIGHKQGKVELAQADGELRYLVGVGAPGRGEVWGLGALLQANPVLQAAYGCQAVDSLDLPGLPWRRAGVWQQAALNGAQLDVLWQAALPFARQVLSDFTFEPEMFTPVLEGLRPGFAGREEASS